MPHVVDIQAEDLNLTDEQVNKLWQPGAWPSSMRSSAEVPLSLSLFLPRLTKVMGGCKDAWDSGAAWCHMVPLIASGEKLPRVRARHPGTEDAMDFVSFKTVFGPTAVEAPGEAGRARKAGSAQACWVSVKELKTSCHNSDTIVFTLYIHSMVT